MSFHWEYEGKGEKARCIHTWGDGGVMECFVEYKNWLTRARNGEGAVTEYYYGADKLIYKIVDANGGVPRQLYNEFQELEVVVDRKASAVKGNMTNTGISFYKRMKTESPCHSDMMNAGI